MGSYEMFENIETSEMTNPLEIEHGIVLEHIGENKETPEALEVSDSLIGTPEIDSENWHHQAGENSCAVCCQEFIAEQLLGENFSEKQLCDFAEKKGWFDPETGTTMSDIGNILEEMGLSVERENKLSLSDLAEKIEDGDKVICGVSSAILGNVEMDRIPGITADHAVQVIGIDYSDKNNVRVILNDSGVTNGKGRIVSADAFLKAWNKSDNYTVTARRNENGY